MQVPASATSVQCNALQCNVKYHGIAFGRTHRETAHTPRGSTTPGRYVTLRYVTLNYITSRGSTTPRTLRYVMLCYVTLQYAPRVHHTRRVPWRHTRRRCQRAWREAARSNYATRRGEGGITLHYITLHYTTLPRRARPGGGREGRDGDGGASIVSPDGRPFRMKAYRSSQVTNRPGRAPRRSDRTLHYITSHHLVERREPVGVMAGNYIKLQYIILHYVYLTFHASERAARVAWHLKCARHHAIIATYLGGQQLVVRPLGLGERFG